MPVVMEKRIVFEPRDILKARLQCGICGGEFTFPSHVQSLVTCPVCGKDFKDLPADHISRDGYRDETRRLEQLISLLDYFSQGDYGRRRPDEKVPWKILLDLPGDLD